MTEWANFLSAAATAASALVGLLFVTISINLARIIEIPGVSGRAAEALIILSGTLASTLLGLVPNFSSSQLGAAILLVTIPTWIVPMWIQFDSVRHHTFLKPSHVISRALLHQAATLPGILAGLGLVGLFSGAMLWLAAGAVASMLVAVCNAWVLLVEILR
jgi:hypothetical protein